MKSRLAVLAIGLMTLVSTALIFGVARAGAVPNCATITNAQKFRVDPTPARLTATGTVVKAFTGRCLVPNRNYVLHDPACNFGRDRTIKTDSSGVLVARAVLSHCTPGTYYTTLTQDFDDHKAYLATERLTSPAPCARGAAPTVAAVPNNAPLFSSDTVMETIVGECYPALAPVELQFKACGESSATVTADAYGRFYYSFRSFTCEPGAFGIKVIADYPPFGSTLATGTQKIDP